MVGRMCATSGSFYCTLNGVASRGSGGKVIDIMVTTTKRFDTGTSDFGLMSFPESGNEVVTNKGSTSIMVNSIQNSLAYSSSH